MAIVFTCPYCKTVLKGADELKGKTGRCPKCAEEITVPNKSVNAHGRGQATVEH